MRKFTKRGFTLIELLVVIAVIGILSSIVLVSLAGARDKARDAKIQSDVGQVRPLAEMINDNDNDYDDVCTGGGLLNEAHGTYGGQLVVINADITAQGGYAVCWALAQEYCTYSVLNVGGGTRWYCADSTGKAGVFTVDPVGTCHGGAVPSYTCE